MNRTHGTESRVLIPIFLTIATCAAFSGCSRPVESTKLPENSAIQEALTDALRQTVAEANDPALEEFYGGGEFRPVWVNLHGLTGRGEQALVALRGAAVRGLHPEDYPVALDQPDEPSKLARADVALTRGMLQLASDLRWGKHNTGLYGVKPGPASQLALAVAQDPDGVEAGLEKLDPPFAEYKRLLAALPKHRETGTPEEVTLIERTLDKWRQLPREFERGPIIVNVPEFMLRVFDDQLQTVMTMRAIVGLPKHQTPIFSGRISYLMFGPYWNVPTSILQNEVIPDIEKDRTYLKRNAYEVQDQQGKVVSTGDVSDEVLEGLKSNEYRIRQVPGAKNALGRVKFMFPNQENVYLHDTNNRSLFQRTVRALSHGCVRVEKPQELAEWVLQNESAWPKERIAAALKTTKEQRANVKEPIPILMVYHTVTANEAGELTFHKDIYGRDQD